MAAFRALVVLGLVAAMACPGAAVPRDVRVLLFTGSGTSANDVTAVEAILERQGTRYATIGSAQLNASSEADLRHYGLFIIPGGDFIRIADGLTPGATATIRSAVDHGLHYLGICAGGFLAGDVRGHHALALTRGVRFGFYAAEAKGIRKAPVLVTTPRGAPLEQYWEDGPQFSGWGSVVGTYPDGTPAIVEGAYGRGWVLLTGVHAEAPEGWRRGLAFRTSSSVDNDYAGVLLQAALQRTVLPHF